MYQSTQMPLALAPEGALVEIVGYATNFGRGVMHKVTSLGLIPGTTVRIVRNQFAGPILLDIRGFRVFIGHGVATKILVRVIG
ncbi:MAG: FeoA family protein [Candidatus Asgardarchaeia archaeon]